jgi:alanine dehydrogenase
MKLADLGFERAMKDSKELRGALNTYNGILTNKAVSDAVHVPYTPIETALGL